MTCIGKDPRCPCQDGDACHYKDCGGTKAWPVPKAEPVAWRYALDASVEGPRWIYIDKDPHQWLKGPVMAGAVIETLYTTPPQRKELSASEILNMMPSTIPAEYDGELMEFARAVEAKLKERNT